MSKPVLGYWDFRGYAQQHRLLLTYLGVDFEDRRYRMFKPEPESSEPTKEFWLADKFDLDLDYPNLPYWIDDRHEIRLTESKAILKYIAKTRGGGKCYPETTDLQAVAEMVEGLLSDLQLSLAVIAYGPPGNPEKPLKEVHSVEFTRLENFFAKRPWVTGENISYVDFYVYEVLKEYSKYKDHFLHPFPALLNFLKKVEALPELEKYVKSTEDSPCFSPYATLKF